MRPQLSEFQVAQIWNDQSYDRSDLRTTEGAPVSIVYRGRWSYGKGPDFQRALVSFGGGRLVGGDVEIHLRSSDWFAHGHHTDPNYDTVVLHVVVWDDASRPSLTPNGEQIPTLVLDGRLPDTGVLGIIGSGSPLGSIQAEHCGSASVFIEAERAGKLLDELGDLRFSTKVAVFEGEIAAGDADQPFYAGVLEALGYSANQTSFRRLAALLPLLELYSLTAGRAGADKAIAAQAAMLGVAGLLPSQCEEHRPLDWESGDFAEELEAVWSVMAPVHGPDRLTRSDWVFSRTRPANYPTRRIAAVAYLFASGAFAKDAFLGRMAKGVDYRAMQHNWVVSHTPDIWSGYADFGLPLMAKESALVGAGRAADILVNVELPYVVALSQSLELQETAATAWEVFRSHPPLASNDLIESTARQVLGAQAKSVVKSARRQQGLLHLYKAYCVGMRCYECPVMAEVIIEKV